MNYLDLIYKYINRIGFENLFFYPERFVSEITHVGSIKSYSTTLNANTVNKNEKGTLGDIVGEICFANFKTAYSFLKKMSNSNFKNVLLTRRDDLFIVRFESFSDEFIVFFRNGVKWSENEDIYLITQYLMGNNTKKIALLLGRKETSINSRLMKNGYKLTLTASVESTINFASSLNLFERNYPDYIYVDGIECLRQLCQEVEENDSTYSASLAYIDNRFIRENVEEFELTSQDWINIRKILCTQTGQYDDRSSHFLHEFGETSLHYGDKEFALVVSLHEKDWLLFYRVVLQMSDQHHLWQIIRDKISNLLLMKVTEELFTFLQNWRYEASERRRDYSFRMNGTMKGNGYLSTIIELAVEHDICCCNENLKALIYGGTFDLTHLTELSNLGNQFASWMLADFSRQRMWLNSNFPLDGDREFLERCGTFIPNDAFIQSLICCLPYDNVIATEFCKRFTPFVPLSGVNYLVRLTTITLAGFD